MKRVLFIGMSPNHGGVETFILNIFNNLDKSKYKCYFVQENNRIIYDKNSIEDNGGIVLNINIGTSYIGHLFRYKQAYSFFKKYGNFFDIIHLNCVTINSVYWLKAAQQFNHNAKLIIHSHNNMTKSSSKVRDYLTELLAHHNLKTLNHLNNVIKLAASDGAGKWMFNSNDFIEIPNGIDTNEYKFNLSTRNKLKDQLGLQNNKVVLSVGRMEYQKNYKKIIDVFKHMLKRDESLRLVICGDGSEYTYIKEYIEKLGIKKDVILAGMVSNMKKMYNIADLLLMPSRYEAFPYVLVESQCYGLPALVASPAVPKECNINGLVHYLSLNDGDEKWSKDAISIMDKKEDKKELNHIMRISEYSLNDMMKKIVSIYNN